MYQLSESKFENLTLGKQLQYPLYFYGKKYKLKSQN